MQCDTVLETVIRNALDVEDYDLQGVGIWARRGDLPESAQRKRDTFRVELKQALREPFSVTPKLFERWTRVDVESQDEVQERLQELWDVCFE